VVLPAAAPQLTDLDLLLSVDRLGSLGKAAREHGMSQPAASLRIKAVERRLGLRLLQRSPSGSQLTPAGATMAAWARTAVDAVTQLLACTSGLQDAGARALRVAASMTTVEYLLPRWLTGLHRRWSDVTVDVSAQSCECVLEQARSGGVDIGFVGEPGPHAGLARTVVGYDELAVVVAPEHPWASRKIPVSATELAASRLVLRERGSGVRETLHQALGETGHNSHLELPSTTAVKQAATEGAGAAVLSRFAVDRELREGWLVRVRVADLMLARKLYAVWHKNAELSMPARTLLEIAAQDVRGDARRADVMQTSTISNPHRRLAAV
jgi:DNA-binding transcriptional LysR family regulator